MIDATSDRGKPDSETVVQIEGVTRRFGSTARCRT